LFGGICRACESSYSPAVLDFHHPDPTKKDFAISDDGIYRTWAKVQKELEVCLMLCANCHAELHAGLRTLNLTKDAIEEAETSAAS
jgi:hypothetical protein